MCHLGRGSGHTAEPGGGHSGNSGSVAPGDGGFGRRPAFSPLEEPRGATRRRTRYLTPPAPVRNGAARGAAAVPHDLPGDGRNPIAPLRSATTPYWSGTRAPVPRAGRTGSPAVFRRSL